MSIVSLMRLVVGGAMVAGGVVLCVPLATEVASAVVRRQEAATGEPASPRRVTAAADGSGDTPPASDSPSAVPALNAAPPLAASPPLVDMPLPAATDLPVRSAYTPPVPPPPFAAPAPTAPVPDVESAYRSMLDIPPPALLDAQRPPSPVSWSIAARPAVPARPLPDALVPASCLVRDGDDLEGIATRYYGHPSAASAIWGANRERIPDPRVLPIGLELRLPPPWTVVPADAAAPSGPGPAIEPPATRGIGMPSPAGAVPAPVAVAAESPAPWLVKPVDAPAVAPEPQPARPAAVRVTPGETLASLARRFYGDEREAERIWLANRDRLRSPALIVPGMELRLP